MATTTKRRHTAERWHELGKVVVRCRRHPGRGWTASVFDRELDPRTHSRLTIPNGRTVIGTYQTDDAALEAAETMLRMGDGGHVCGPADIDEVRAATRKAGR